MSKHTPGPWKLSGFCDGEGGPSIYREEVDEKGRTITTHQILPFYDCDFVSGRNGRRHAADKALIEAAPELLEALQAAVQELYDHAGEEPRSGRYAHLDRVIAKATGATS